MPSKKRKLVADINVVPYIDVMLVLLIVFMVTAPMLTQGVKVDLPQAPSKPLEEKDEPILVSIKADGSFYMDLGGGGNQQQAVDKIVATVAKVITAKPKTPVLIWGDKGVDYGEVVKLMAALQGAGVAGVGLVTEPPSGSR
ncbi:MAG: protein TolR [Porticoccaceae bacterium]